MMRIFCLFWIFLFTGVFSVMASEASVKKATFLPQWSPQAQFAGYYVAYEKGFYQKYGIDLTLLQGGPEHSPIDCLKKGKADFITLWLSTAIQKRSKGTKLLNLGQILQRSALMLVAKKSRGIRQPRDIDGKKVGLWGADFQIQPKAFLKKYNLKAKVIPQSFSINLFLRDGVDVASAMWYNEYHTMLNAGLNPEELTTFFFYEHGLNFPEDGVYALKETFKRDPSLSCAFVRASIEGWYYAFSHAEEALDIVLHHIRLSKSTVNRVHQKWMLERMRDLILPPDGKGVTGILNPVDYKTVASELLASGAIDNIPSFDKFYVHCPVEN